jgi:hypothetical protein
MKRISVVGPCAAVSILAFGCGSPDVNQPNGNSYILHPAATTAPPLPMVEALPSPYSFHSIPIRGTAQGAVRVVISINEAGNTIAADVSQLDHTYCAEVTLTEPAFYDITVTAMADDSEVSDHPSTLSLQFDPMAMTAERVTLCDGSIAK